MNQGWPAPAKLNLFLHITGRRADGYHLLQSVFQFLDYGDTLYFEPRADGEIHRLTAVPGVAPEQDLVVRAARRLQQAGGCRLGADIRIDKRLPMGGGLGGGSSDAATTLVALNRLWSLGLDQDRLAEIGLALGADVPVFVRGHAAWAEGVGEHLQPVDLPEPWFLVLIPPVTVSTAEVFAAGELTRDCPPIKIRDFLRVADSGRADGRIVNVCEPLVRQRYPEVDAIFNWLSDKTPTVARMTGTGACLFAPFEDERQARQLLDQAPCAGFVARGLNRSPLLARVEAPQALAWMGH